PILIIPGMHPNVIAVAVGYGRSSNDAGKTGDYLGKAVVDAGKNVYPMLSFNGTTAECYAVATIEKTGTTYRIAQTQVHNATEGRPVIREKTLSVFIANPEEQRREDE